MMAMFLSAPRKRAAWCLGIVAIVSAALCGGSARAAVGVRTIVTFNGTGNGANPYAGVTFDASGDLYGTTVNGGSANDGTVFEVDTTGTFSTPVTFTGSANGASPRGNLTLSADGKYLFGTTSSIGPSNGGTVFQLTTDTTHTLTTAAAFSSTAATGYFPFAGVTADAAGNLYGTAYLGGSSSAGAIYELTAQTKTTFTASPVVTFNGTGNGSNPRAPLIADTAGNLYGTTTNGGTSSDGTVFEVSATGHALSTLATFTGTANGANPYAGLVMDSTGDLFGTTYNGGAGSDGTVFEVAATTHKLTTLATFNGTNGANPSGGLTLDANGDLFGTTYNGGGSSDGTAFEVAAGALSPTTLLSFNGTGNGANPQAGLTADAAGNLYGTTANGGANSDGTAFELTNTGFAISAPEPTSLTLLTAVCVGLASGRRRPPGHR